MRKTVMGSLIILILIGLVIGFNNLRPANNWQKTEQDALKPEKSGSTQQADSKIDYITIGFDLLHKESLGFLKYGLTDSDVKSMLGEADEQSKAAVWEADGEEHQTWGYQFKGIELDMINRQEHQIVNMITIKSPCSYRTLRNIGIGSDKNEVISAYRNEINPDGGIDSDSITAGTRYGGIIFKLEGDRVSTIFIGASAE